MKRRNFIQLGGPGLSVAGLAGGTLYGAEIPAPTRKHIREEARQIPVVKETEVLVCGAGPAGIGAALAAARTGAKTTLIEVHGCLGGIWTAGALPWILDGNDKPGIMREIMSKMQELGAHEPRTKGRFGNVCNVETMKLLLEDLCLEAGVSIRYLTRVVHAVRGKDDRLTHVVTESKSGREAFAAQTFIDCTGDGDLAALAGCGFDYGHPETGEAQPFSMMAILAGVDAEEIAPFYHHPGEGWAESKDRLRQEMERGGHSPSYAKPTLFEIRRDLFLMMANHQYGVSALDASDVTLATLEARKEIHRLIDGLRSLGGPWKDVHVVMTSEQIGTREGRRIHGRYTVNEEDLRTGARHDDAVCRVNFGIDVHSTSAEKGKGIESQPFHSKPYDIPLRALIAKDVDGLMMAGRCISGDFLAHSSYRVTGNAVAMGEAAGRACAAAVARGCLPHEVDAKGAG